MPRKQVDIPGPISPLKKGTKLEVVVLDASDDEPEGAGTVINPDGSQHIEIYVPADLKAEARQQYIAEESLAAHLTDAAVRYSYSTRWWENSSKPDLRSSLSINSLIIPDRKTAEGILVRSANFIWLSVIEELKDDWTKALEIPSDAWEELIAGAFKRAGFDDVTLTPRSGDHGRDIIAITKGVGCVKIIGSVKAYKPGHLVKHDDVRALLGVLSGEQNASKGIVATTSDFAPTIKSDPYIKPFLPTRLELINGSKLQEWLVGLARNS